METKEAKSEDKKTLDRQSGSMRSSNLGKKLDSGLKSWLDNVIIPALVREYLCEIETRNRLATSCNLEVTSDKDGVVP
jgi:hypothetical protein